MQAAKAEITREGGIERRRDERYTLMLPGKFVRGDGSEVWCVSENASVSGFEIIAGKGVMMGERLTLLLHHLDRMDIEVMRLTPRGFGARIVRTSLTREVFTTQLKWLIESQSRKGTVDQRQHQRVAPNHKETTVQLKGHKPVPATLVDISRSGAAIRADVVVRFGQRVLIGSFPSTVVRVGDGVFAVKFDKPLDERKPPETVALI